MILENMEGTSLVIAADSIDGAENMEVVNLAAKQEDTTEFLEITDAQGEVTSWSEIGVITGVGYFVVFMVLALLIIVFNNLPKLLNLQLRKRLRREGKLSDDAVVINVSGEVNAAIATALMIYMNEQHDEESNVITIKRVAKVYSPWSSKIYGLNNYLRSR